MLDSYCYDLKLEYEYMTCENPAFDRKVEQLKREALAIIRKEHDWADMAIQRMYDDRPYGGKNITDKIPYMRYCWALFALNQAVDRLEGIEAVKAIAEIKLPSF